MGILGFAARDRQATWSLAGIARNCHPVAMAERFRRWVGLALPGGWVRLKDRESGGTVVYLRFEPVVHREHTRFKLRDLIVRGTADDDLTTRMFRRIPITELEQAVEDPVVKRAFTAEPFAPLPSLDDLDAYFDAEPPAEPWDGIFGAQINFDWHAITSDGEGEIPAGECPIVRKPADGRLTDEFLSVVGEAYRWLANANMKPSPSIANMAGVPVATARHWIYQARKRGIMPPGRPGRAG